MYVIKKEEIKTYIKNKKIIFSISKNDIQDIAENTLDRKLSLEEMSEVCQTILNELIIWEDWISEIITITVPHK